MLVKLRARPSYVYIFSDTESQHEENGLVTSLDGDFNAWAFLVATFMIEVICWGFPTAAGVFVSYYQAQPQFANQDMFTSIGTVATGVSGLLNPVIFYVGANYPGQRLNFIRIGALICVTAAVGAAFSNTAVAVFLTQGLLWRLGSALCIIPVLSLLPEWFERRKGFAYGVMYATLSLILIISFYYIPRFGGFGVTGAGLPSLFTILLDK
ncbi:hypothetical protein IFR05_002984 [Cadophora sp. M221]|nr:hypothetical protein IFR05_002984 [Cadophora sp. M221]